MMIDRNQASPTISAAPNSIAPKNYIKNNNTPSIQLWQACTLTDKQRIIHPMVFRFVSSRFPQKTGFFSIILS